MSMHAVHVFEPACCSLVRCRESSFGHGTLDLLNSTHATWSWTKNQGAAFNVAHQVTIVRGSGGKACSAPPAAATAAAASGRQL
jgi:hypothetical protein